MAKRKSKTTTTILSFFLGGLGIHRFYLGQTTIGIVYLIFSWTFIPVIISLVDFFVFLFMTDSKFDTKYNSSVEEKEELVCAECGVRLTFSNTPVFGSGKLSTGGQVCLDCFKKRTKEKNNVYSEKLKARQVELKAKIDDYKQNETKLKADKPKTKNENLTRTISATNNDVEKKNITVASLIKSIKTIDDVKALEKESERLMDKFVDSSYGNTRLEKLSDIYQEAFDEACELIFYYQFVPRVDLDTPKEILDYAYEVFPVKDYEAKRKEIGGTQYEWEAIKADELCNDKLDNVITKRPFYWKTLLSFRQIADSKESFSKKKEAINLLVKSDKSFFDEFFLRDSFESAGDQWLKQLIRSFGVPLADKLYDLGYDTPEKIKDIDLNEVKNINGFGPQKIAQLETAMRKIEKTLINDN
jgi:TM2 domain-containing membrane protein YozV